MQRGSHLPQYVADADVAITVDVMKYFRHFPLAVWACVALSLGAVLAFAQYRVEPVKITRTASAPVLNERGNAMALISHLSTVHAAAAPPAAGLAQWGTETAGLAQAYADARAAHSDDAVASAYRDVAAAALGLASVDPSNREQILAGMASLGAAGNKLGAAVNNSSIRYPGGEPDVFKTSVGFGQQGNASEQPAEK